MKFEETARRLRMAMDAKGIKQQELADLSGVDKTNISHYVNGRNIPDNFKAFALGQVLGVTPEWLMDLKDDPELGVVKWDEVLFARKMRQLNQPDRDVVIALVNALLDKEEYKDG